MLSSVTVGFVPMLLPVPIATAGLPASVLLTLNSTSTVFPTAVFLLFLLLFVVALSIVMIGFVLSIVIVFVVCVLMFPALSYSLATITYIPSCVRLIVSV